jgi:hypothetical protein
MTKPTKTLLALALFCLVAGFPFSSGMVDARSAVVLLAVLPTGAVFLGLFLISLIFEKETARYDAEQRACAEAAATAGAATASASAKSAHS